MKRFLSLNDQINYILNYPSGPQWLFIQYLLFFYVSVNHRHKSYAHKTTFPVTVLIKGYFYRSFIISSVGEGFSVTIPHGSFISSDQNSSPSFQRTRIITYRVQSSNFEKRTPRLFDRALLSTLSNALFCQEL